MIDSHELKRRDSYLNKLIGFQDTEPVKVITGIRRCGKSSLLKLMVRHLKDTGIQPEQIIEMNFESFDFRGMSADDIYHYVKERVVTGKRMYLFFDELQRIEAWEDAVNAFRVDLDCDIYVTGSNAYLLSSEYSTYLDSASRYLIRTVNATNCEKFLTPVCASVECPESPMLGWNRKRHCRFSTASIPQS